MERYSDFQDLTNSIATECENDDALKAARSEIFAELDISVKRLKTERDTAENSADRQRAARSHLELAGLFVEKVQHSGAVGFVPLELSRGEANA